MLINKTTHSYLTRSDKPDTNWVGNGYYLVPDGTDLAKKIIEYYPRCEYVIENDQIVGVSYKEKTQAEIDEERKTEIHNRLEELDKTINRATEDLYELTDTTPYIAVQEVIDEKVSLREELQTLGGGVVEGDN